MLREQYVYRKKLVRSDGLLLLLVLLVVFSFTLFLGFLEQRVSYMSRPLQFLLFFTLLAMAYVIVTRQLTSFRYVLAEEAFSVYRCMGKQQRLVEHVKIPDIRFIAPYLQMAGERGREHALCGGRKQEAWVVAYEKNSRSQWVLVSLNDSMLAALMELRRTAPAQDQ